MPIVQVFKEELACMKLEKEHEDAMPLFDFPDVIILFMFVFTGFTCGLLFALAVHFPLLLMFASGLVLSILILIILLAAIFIVAKYI